MINPKAEYHYLQEVMREPFYSGKWDVTKCERHSLFMSQGSYPIKGLHLALEAVYFLRQKYNDVKLYVAGPDLHEKKDFRKRIRMGSYQKYVIKLIHEKHLENNVVFTDNLTAEQMKERYLKCNCFLSASSIENSPNSVGEALCLGVPVVASMAGGTGSLFDHGKEGFLYQADAPYMAAHYIGRIFSDDALADRIGEKAYNRAKTQYSVEDIFINMLKLYREILSE
jgi:glycosyltransferase involved in cell wall biosynthesis